MSKARSDRGVVYRCPVCGAEVAVLAARAGDFRPVCCHVAMVALPRRLTFLRCPVCGAEVAVVLRGGGRFEPRCCNVAMAPVAA